MNIHVGDEIELTEEVVPEIRFPRGNGQAPGQTDGYAGEHG